MWLHRIDVPQVARIPLGGSLSFEAFPLAHGRDCSHAAIPIESPSDEALYDTGMHRYESTAFFIHDSISDQEFYSLATSRPIPSHRNPSIVKYGKERRSESRAER